MAKQWFTLLKECGVEVDLSTGLKLLRGALEIFEESKQKNWEIVHTEKMLEARKRNDELQTIRERIAIKRQDALKCRERRREHLKRIVSEQSDAAKNQRREPMF
jgi:hypothetical protein